MTVDPAALQAHFALPRVLSCSQGGDGGEWWWGPAPSEAPEITVNADPASGANHCTIQGAVDQAIREQALFGRSRRIIRVQAGFYEGPVILPKSAPPMSILGEGAGQCLLAARIDAQMPGEEYAARFAPIFERSPVAVRAIFAAISARAAISTGNSAVLRVACDETVVSGLTIRNTYACDRRGAAPEGAEPDVMGRFAEGQHQAVALHVAGADRVLLEGLALSSFQDTLYLQSDTAGRANRVFVNACEIAGDVDFIFGGAVGYFQSCKLVSRGERGAKSWVVAPSTPLHQTYGFVFANCEFSHDGAEAGRDGGCFLGRQWFEGVRATPYGLSDLADAPYACVLSDRNKYAEPESLISHQTLEAVGKCAVIGGRIGGHIPAARPWDDWGGPSWSPRYRPAQHGPEDFLGFLGAWLEAQGAPYGEIAGGLPWLLVLPEQA